MDADPDQSAPKTDRFTVHQYVLVGEIVVAAFWCAALINFLFFWIIVSIIGGFIYFKDTPLYDLIVSLLTPFGGVFAIGYAFRELISVFNNKVPQLHWFQLIALLGAFLATFEFSRWADFETAMLIASPMWIIAIHLFCLVLYHRRRPRSRVA